MTIAQCRATRRRMKLRYGEGRRFGHMSIQEAVERERERALREQAAKKKKK